MLNIKNDNEKLNYVGNFGTFSKEGEIIKYSQNKGDYVELNFIGNKVRFYTHTNAWRVNEGIYNFYFNNCILPTNYVFCPSNRTSWIKQIIK